MKMSINDDEQKRSILDSGYDRLLRKRDVIEEGERQFQARIKEQRDEDERRERMRTQRLAASGKSPLLYSLDTIIEACLMDEEAAQIEVDFFDLGFSGNMHGISRAKELFGSLKRARCFLDFEFIHRTHSARFIISGPDIGKLRDYKSDIAGKLGVAESQKGRRLIRRDGHGEYFYDGIQIEMNKNTLPYDLVDILFSCSDGSGFLSYSVLEKYLVERNHPQKQSDKTISRRVRNALTNGLFKVAKVNGQPLKNSTPDGKQLIKTMRGKGLKFNNPEL
jgi:hypothetical protein